MSSSQSPSEDKGSEIQLPQNQPKKRTARKKKGEIEQSTCTKPHYAEKQTLLTRYCRKAISIDTNTSSPKSEEFLQSYSNTRIQELEQDLRRKDEQIQKLQADRDREQTKLANVSSEYKLLMSNARQAMVRSTRQLADIKRRDRGAINPKMGYFSDLNCVNFVEGSFLAEVKAQISNTEQNVAQLSKKVKTLAEDSEKQLIQCHISHLRSQITQLKGELVMREKELTKYKEKLRLRKKEQQCQMFKQKWPLLKNRYLPIELIGSGGFGEVYKAFDFQRFAEVALKISLPDHRLSQAAHQNLAKHLKREVSTHKQLQHPNIVRVLDQLEDLDNGRLGFVMEYCSGPQLKSYLKKLGCIEEREARNILRQLIFAVKYLHEQKMKIVHFDLKPANILFHNGVLKIVDFGICKLIQTEETKIELTSPGIGTYWYLPPEIFDEEKAHVSSKVDIWSVGVIFFQMLYGEKPFGNGLSQAKIMRQGTILNAFKVEFPAETPKKYKVSDQAKNFIRACLKYNPDERLSSSQAFQHEYIKK